MKTAKVKIKKLHPAAIIPKYAHGPKDDAGMDIYAIEEVILRAHVPTAVATGLAIELPFGFEAQLRGRSGLGLNHGIRVAQGVGTIDPSYQGELKGILVWEGYNPNHYLNYADENEYTMFALEEPVYRIQPGDRIMQMIVAEYAAVEYEEVLQFYAHSSRGTQGFGSSGK